MWIPANQKYGVAIHNWHGNVPHGLDLDVGDSVEILEECGPWLRGTCPRKPRSVGLFPRTYIHVKDTARADPIVTECTQVLREWSETWKKLFVERDTYKYAYLRKVMLSLLESRRELLGATLTQDQTQELQMKVISKIDWGNRKLGIDLVPRIGPLEVDPHQTGIVSLHNVHVKSADNASASSSHGTLRKKSTNKKALTHHLYFCMRDFGHRIGDDAEIYFHLYDAHTQRSRPLSERFCVRIAKDGFANYIEKLHSNCTVFTDLGGADLNADLYLVAHIMRVGKMIASDSVRKADRDRNGGANAPATPSYRRPYGVGVLSLADIAAAAENAATSSTAGGGSGGGVGSTGGGSDGDEREYSFKCFQCDEKDFHTLHADLIAKKSSGKFTLIQMATGSTSGTSGSGSGTATGSAGGATAGHPSSGGGSGAGGGVSAGGIVVSVKLLHGSLHQARLEQPALFHSTAITRKTGFPDIIMPGDVRNDVFFTLERGEFERGGKSTAKNIEVCVTVLDAAGHIIPDCLSGASGQEPCFYYKSMILYHNNAPSWGEMIRLSVPIDVFAGAHIRFDFRHCSTRDKAEPKLFAFAFARLMEPSGATLADRQHELYVYKCEDVAKLQAAQYLRMRCSAVDDQADTATGTAFARSAKECFHMRSLLCSTKLTQNGDLLSLLQWRTHPERIQDSLQRVLNLRDEELVKFLQDVLDALFAMFSNEEGNSTEHSGLVFHVLVSIFYLLQSTRFQHFKPVMEAYIEDHFAAALVYKGLIFSVRHLADWMSTTERREPIQKCFGSLEWIFKLIIQSRRLFARATSGQYEDSFRKDLYSLFAAFNGMLAATGTGGQGDEDCVPTQEALLHSVGVVLVQLEGTLSANELGALAKNMLDAVPREAVPRLTRAKLQAVRDLVGGQLFANEECRSIVLALACRHVRVHLGRRDELRLCGDILAEIVGRLWELRRAQADKMSNTLQHDLNALCRSVLDPLMQTILVIMEGSPAVLGGLVAVLLGLLQLLDETNYVHLWDELSGGGDLGELRDFLQRGMLVFKELLAQDWQVYPPDWLVMRLQTNDVVRRALEEFAKPLVYRFLTPVTFDAQLWWSYFSLTVAFLTQPCLQLEQYHETKRRKILNTHGDMRVLMGFQILSMWSQLGEHKLQFIPSMVGPFLEVTLVPEPALRKATLTVFYDMMQCEQAARGSFRLVESELIDKLDLLISENKGDDEYRELFSTILSERVAAEEPPWRVAGAAFITSVTRLLERLLDYRSVMQGEENRDKRMSCTVNLLHFYKNEINRREMYLRYIYKLHALHVQSENYAEAGFTLKLYADMLSWERESLTFSPLDAAGQPEWLRKERLYNEILDYFDKGKCWEKGIPLCKELADFYETRRFDYARLGDILKRQADFYHKILTQIRPEPEYFRVGFYGAGFPLFVRNKQFVYRGLEYERIGAFTQRLQTEFAQAQILTRNAPPEAALLVDERAQWIQISTVRPLADVPEVLRTASVPVPERIERFYHVNDVRRFQHDRPVYKGAVDKENEFKSLWIERTTMDVACTLPGILRWFEVTSRSTLELTPVEFACETMANVERELLDLIGQYRAEPAKNINPFSMRLQGCIDANVMGGISKYQAAFFSEEFARSAEGRSQLANVHRLRCLIADQVGVLETALELHGQLAPAGVQPLHQRLCERFGQLRDSLAATTASATAAKMAAAVRRPNSDSIVNTPLPPLPTEATAAATVGRQPPQQQRSASMDQQQQSQLLSNGDAGDAQPLNRDCLPPLDLNRSTQHQTIYSAPPIPSRPRSACYSAAVAAATAGGAQANGIGSSTADGLNVTGAIITGSPEIPPKGGSKAPPLPPRGYTPDKRASNPMVPAAFDGDAAGDAPAVPHLMPRRVQPLRLAAVNISLDDNAEATMSDGVGGFDEGVVTAATEDCAEADHQYQQRQEIGTFADDCHDDDGQHNYTSTAGMNNLGAATLHNNYAYPSAVYHYPMPPLAQRSLSNGSGSSAFAALNISLHESGAPPIPPKSVAAVAASTPSTAAAAQSAADDEDGYCVPKELVTATSGGQPH